jgi:hypothetical protein
MLGGADGAPDFTPGYFVLFGATLLLEAPWYVPWITLRGRGLKRGFEVLFFANLATHPAITFIFPPLAVALGWNVLTSLVAKEAFAFVVETAVIRFLAKLSWRESVALSFCANLFSWWLGAYLV